jgi:hypothetical protein
MLRSLPTSDILRSASRSAATAGGTPSSSAIRKIFLVVANMWVAPGGGRAEF